MIVINGGLDGGMEDCTGNTQSGNFLYRVVTWLRRKKSGLARTLAHFLAHGGAVQPQQFSGGHLVATGNFQCFIDYFLFGLGNQCMEKAILCREFQFAML